MQLISIGFVIFWLITLSIYYVFPKYQWEILLLASICFYVLYAKAFPIMILVCAVSMWVIGRIKKAEKRRFFLIIVIIADVLVLAFYKFYSGGTFYSIRNHVPIGLSFFVLVSMGYCLDVYWERVKPEKSICKLVLFLSFFPMLLQGPICKYGKLQDELFKVHKFSFDSVCKGLQRFLWGLFKKLIIVDRLAQITNAVFSDVGRYNVSIISVGVICYAIELYADFSGYMDLIIGIAKTFDIQLPENFKRPYFSTSVAEFWRRWHITLGIWFKDYVMYAFLMSTPIKKLKKQLRQKNKKLGSLFPTIIGTLLVWILTGLWHGNSFGYMLWGLFYGVVICSTLCLENFYDRIKKRSGFVQSKLYRIFCIFRTLFIVYIADVFICMDSWGNLKIYAKKILQRDIIDHATIHQLGDLINSGRNVILLIFGCFLLLIVSLTEEKRGEEFLSIIRNRNIVIRWSVWYALIFIIFLFGTYGTGYDTSTFMYQVF